MSTGKIIALTVAVFVVIVGLVLGIYFAAFATANTRGRIQQHNQLNKASNMTQQQRAFYNEYADIKAQALNEKVALDAYNQAKTDGADSTTIANDYTTYAGIKQGCNANVQKYNQAAADNTRNLFLEANLPTSIPDNYCEVSK